MRNGFENRTPFSFLFFVSVLFIMVSLTDIDECAEDVPPCAFRCQNTPGSYRCICPKGYQLALDKIHCEGKVSFNIKTLKVQLDAICKYDVQCTMANLPLTLGCTRLSLVYLITKSL